MLRLAALALIAPGCAGMRASREARPILSRPPMLGRRSVAPIEPAAALAQADPVADRLRIRPTRAGMLAAVEAPGLIRTRSTAPPPGAVLASVPVAIEVASPGSRLEELEPLPPLTGLTPPSEPLDPLRQIRSLVEESKAQLAPVRTYRVRMTRQERVGDTLQPEEDVLLSIRREPRAVRLEWTEGPNAGREVLYSAAPHGGLMHIHMPSPLVPRMSLPPDSPLALRNSRHPITEAGLDAILARLDESVALHEAGRGGAERLTYEGLRTPIPGGPPCHTIQRVTPEGETWLVAIDAQTHCPLLVQETARDGSLLERYVFRDPQTDLPELSAATAFDPDSRWGPSKGLLGRLARSSGNEAGPDESTTR